MLIFLKTEHLLESLMVGLGRLSIPLKKYVSVHEIILVGKYFIVFSYISIASCSETFSPFNTESCTFCKL